MIMGLDRLTVHAMLCDHALRAHPRYLVEWLHDDLDLEELTKLLVVRLGWAYNDDTARTARLLLGEPERWIVALERLIESEEGLSAEGEAG
jgi:hypothetical protein